MLVSPLIYTILKELLSAYLQEKYLLPSHNFPGNYYSWESLFLGKNHTAHMKSVRFITSQLELLSLSIFLTMHLCWALFGVHVPA